MLTAVAITDYGVISVFLGSLIALYSAAAWSNSRWWWTVLPVRVAMGIVGGGDAADWVFIAGLAVVSVVAGRIVFRSRRVADELVRVNEALRDVELMAWDFVMSFARDNNLQVADACLLPEAPKKAP